MKPATISISILALALLGLLAGCRSPSAQLREARFHYPELTQRAAAYAHFSAGIVQQVGGNLPNAWEEFYLAAKTDRTDAELLADVSQRLIEGKQFTRAVEVLEWAAKLPGADGAVFTRLGFVYAQLGKTRKAIEANRAAVKKAPKFFPAWNNLYLNHVQARQPERALATLDEANRQAGVEAEYRLSLAELYVGCGKQFPVLRERTKVKALALLEQLRAEDSLRGLQRMKLADGFYLLGEGETAAKLYLEFLTHGEPPSPLRDILRAKLTEIYLRDKDHTRALEQLSEIVRENPANAGAQYFLGSLAMENRRWEDAIRCFQQALRVNPDFVAARLDLAAAELAAGKVEEALLTLGDVRKRKATNYATEYLTGMAYHIQEKYAEALPYFQAAEALALTTETNRLNAGLYFQLGAASERVGKRTAAAGYFEKCIAMAPEHAEALNYLGYMWAERGENLGRARQLIERALKLEPDNEAFLDSMGWVLFQLGEARQALPYLEKAVASLSEPDATVHDHLGDVYAALNEMDKAREAWAKSLTVENNSVVRQKLDGAKTKPTP